MILRQSFKKAVTKDFERKHKHGNKSENCGRKRCGTSCHAVLVRHGGIYPTKANAQEGFGKGWLYVAEIDGKLAESVIYLHEQEEAYNQVKWPEEIPGDNVYVIHVLAVHPDFFRMGVGTALLDYACGIGRESGAGAVLLDVYERIFQLYIYMKAVDFISWDD